VHTNVGVGNKKARIEPNVCGEYESKSNQDRQQNSSTDERIVNVGFTDRVDSSSIGLYNAVTEPEQRVRKRVACTNGNRDGNNRSVILSPIRESHQSTPLELKNLVDSADLTF
jgi:hypothetical protein